MDIGRESEFPRTKKTSIVRGNSDVYSDFRNLFASPKLLIAFDNYYPCFKAIEPQLANPATILADNVGIGADAMANYLEHVRGAK